MVNYDTYSQAFHHSKGFYGPILADYKCANIKRVFPVAENYEEVLQDLLALGFFEAGFDIAEKNKWQEKVLEKLPGLRAQRHLNPEEALFLITGVIGNHAVYRFECNGKNVFTMRPDYGRSCILTNLSKPPINSYEEKIREKMLHHSEKIAAIYSGIKHGEIQNLVSFEEDMEAPLEDWIAFFQSRGFDLSHIPSECFVDKYSVLMAENDFLAQELSCAKKQIDQLKKDGCSDYPMELSIAISVFKEYWKNRPQDMNPASAETIENFIRSQMGDKVEKAAVKRISTIAKPTHERAGGAPSSERRMFKGHSAEKIK